MSVDLLENDTKMLQKKNKHMLGTYKQQDTEECQSVEK